MSEPQQTFSEADLLSAGAQLCYIYTLHASNDPTCRPRYVGFTINPKGREKQHYRKDSSGRKKKWICRLRENGHRAILTIVHCFRSDDLAERAIVEASWIESLRKRFPDLLNDCGGGRGIAVPSASHCKRKSEGQKRRFLDQAERKKISEQFRRYWSNPEARKKQSESQARRNANPADRDKRRVSQKQRWASDDEREKHREKLKQSYADPTVRKKHKAAMADPLVREKMRQRTRRQYLNPIAREMAAESAKRSWQNPEYRAKRKATFERKRMEKILNGY